MKQIIPAILGFIARNINRHVGEMLISRMPSSMRNFVTTIKIEKIQMRIFTGETIGRHMYYYHDFEEQQTNAFLSLVDSTTTLFDIGANMGYYSLQAATVGAKVYAFEPSPEMNQWFAHNIELNTSLKDRITIIPEAVADCNGKVVFYPNRKGNFGVGKIFNDGFEQSSSEQSPIEVTSKTLDTYVQEYGIPNLIKMDIEGAEFFVLKTLPEVLKGNVAPILCIELHPDAIETLGGSTEQIIDTLKKSGYARYALVNDSNTNAGKTLWNVFSKKSLPTTYFKEV